MGKKVTALADQPTFQDRLLDRIARVELHAGASSAGIEATIHLTGSGDAFWLSDFALILDMGRGPISYRVTEVEEIEGEPSAVFVGACYDLRLSKRDPRNPADNQITLRTGHTARQVPLSRPVS
jgi:hypothetical protein